MSRYFIGHTVNHILSQQVVRSHVDDRDHAEVGRDWPKEDQNILRQFREHIAASAETPNSRKEATLLADSRAASPTMDTFETSTSPRGNPRPSQGASPDDPRSSGYGDNVALTKKGKGKKRAREVSSSATQSGGIMSASQSGTVSLENAETFLNSLREVITMTPEEAREYGTLVACQKDIKNAIRTSHWS